MDSNCERVGWLGSVGGLELGGWGVVTSTLEVSPSGLAQPLVQPLSVGAARCWRLDRC